MANFKVAKKALAAKGIALHVAFAKDSQIASWETMGGSSAYVDRTNKAYPILADVFRGDHNDEWVAYIHGRGLKLTKTFPTEAAAKQFVETKLQSRAKDSSQSLGRRARLHKALDAVLDSARGKAKDAKTCIRCGRQYAPDDPKTDRNMCRLCRRG